MSIYVFLGPSLAGEEARRLLEAEYLPPVSAGDVYALMERRPRIIGIIDGLFEQVPSVWHKEILYCLSHGVRVFGSSSMGALRAAELHAFGMEGVGRVFSSYLSGELEDDDEVAVTHGPASMGFRPLSEAMVNIRAGLALAAQHGLISSATHDLLLHRAKGCFYAERSWAAVWKDAREAGVPAAEIAAVQALVARERPNVKRDDAVALLRRIAEVSSQGSTVLDPMFDFEPTSAWCDLVTRTEIKQGRAVAASEAVLNHLRVAAPSRRDLLNELEQTMTLVARKQQFLKERGLEVPTLLDAGIDEDQLLHWYADRSGMDLASPVEYAAALGLGSEQDFIREALSLYLFEHEAETP